MDAMGFGMGCCCLQITFQACSVNEARRMYDAFVPVGPIMVSLAFPFRISAFADRVRSSSSPSPPLRPFSVVCSLMSIVGGTLSLEVSMTGQRRSVD